jgi:flagellar basal body rod protein FlgC
MRIDTMGIAVSGLGAAEDRLATSAQNVANLSTERYVPWRAEAREEPSGGVRVTLSREAQAVLDAQRADPAPPSQTNLVDETVNRSVALGAYRANLSVLRTAEELSEELTRLGARR